MEAIKAHFDGKVIVLDEPADLPVNQSLLIRVEPVGAPAKRMSFRDLIGIANRWPSNPNPRFHSHDQLWKKD